MQKTSWILAFDGDCVLCHWSIRMISYLDLFNRIQFCPITADLKAKAAHLDSVLLIKLSENEHAQTILTQGSAIRILCQVLPPAWPLLPFLYLIPIKILNKAYAFLAMHRYNVFGKTNYCKSKLSKRVSNKILVGGTRVELVTSCMSSKRSNQLS